MEILKRLHMILVLVCCTALALYGCTNNTVTKVDYVETDTFISSADQTSHSELDHARIFKSGTTEERMILKLPTGARDPDDSIDEIFDGLSPLEVIALAPFLMLLVILKDILNCGDSTLTASNLTSAVLKVNILQGTVVSNDLTLYGMAKPWWQRANWFRGHFFSSRGKWTTPGGDLDANVNALGTVSGTEVSFDITNYFRTLIANTNSPHFGMALVASGAALGSTVIASSQYAVSTSRPRLVSTYTCASPTASHEAGSVTHTTILDGAPVETKIP